MKKELIIVILIVIAIIGISVILKYVIFKNYSSESSGNDRDNLCQGLCSKQGFSLGRCGCECLEGDKKITPEEIKSKGLREKIQESCKIISKNGVVLPCIWICCCR